MQAPSPNIPTYRADTDVPCWVVHHGHAVLAFTTRLGGVSAAPYDSLNLGRSTDDAPAAIAENRRRILTALGTDPARLATAGQVHGATARRVAAPGLHPDTDALVTREPGLAIAITTADCMPLGFAVPGTVAVAHSGWRGTAAGMPRATLLAVCHAAAAVPASVRVTIGPCIRACCYRVGPEVAERFPEAARQLRDGAWHVDLPTAARLELERAGVEPGHIADLGECTSCLRERYYSHRRDRGITGRHWAVAVLS